MLDGHRAAMVADNLAHDRQPQPRSTRLARANKRIERAPAYVLRHTGSLIAYANLERIFSGQHIHGYPALAVWSSLAGIQHQVKESPFQLARIEYSLQLAVR